MHWLNCVCSGVHYGVAYDKVERYIRPQGDRLSVNAASHQEKTCENKQQMLFHTLLSLLPTKAKKSCVQIEFSFLLMRRDRRRFMRKELFLIQ
jgi:hypothetical protein